MKEEGRGDTEDVLGVGKILEDGRFEEVKGKGGS